MNPENHARAVRYRQLSLAEADCGKADLLLKLAEEAERDLLCTSDWLREKHDGKSEPICSNLA